MPEMKICFGLYHKILTLHNTISRHFMLTAKNIKTKILLLSSEVKQTARQMDADRQNTRDQERPWGTKNK